MMYRVQSVKWLWLLSQVEYQLSMERKGIFDSDASQQRYQLIGQDEQSCIFFFGQESRSPSPSLVNVHQLHNFVWRHEAYVHPRYAVFDP